MSEFDLFETHIPARLDRLPWSRWHWFIVVALGATWILDGLEVTLAGSLGAMLTHRETLGLSQAQVGAGGSFYLAGAVLGALLFGYGTDLWGRKKLFFLTVGVYLSATAATAFSWDFASYAVFRFLTGAGIGGEYAAINSAIDELIPARLRGRVNLIINSTFWLGAALGAVATTIVLDPRIFPPWLGWRCAFGIGAVLGLVVLVFRQWVPESPRWLMTHGRQVEAEAVVREVEQKAAAGQPLEKISSDPVRIRLQHRTGLPEIWNAIARQHLRRSVLGLVLMITQAFFYNAIFFTYALVLQKFYGVDATRVGIYLLPFALGNVLGPVLIGHCFDTIGRKPMIAATYALSGVALAITGLLFHAGLLTAQTQTVCWSVTFFFASAAASSAYLTVSEVFPLEIRALAIAIFYAFGTLAGGVGAPLLFGWMIGTGSRETLLAGYLFAAILMGIGALAELLLGVKAERQSLESVAAPLSAVERQ